MNSVSNGIEIMVTLDKGVGHHIDALSQQKGYLSKVIKENASLFSEIKECSIEIGRMKCRAIARSCLLKRENVHDLLIACSISDIDLSEKLFETCFFDTTSKVVIEHFVKCTRSIIDKIGIDAETDRLMSAIECLGEEDVCHYVLTLEEV